MNLVKRKFYTIVCISVGSCVLFFPLFLNAYSQKLSTKYSNVSSIPDRDTSYSLYSGIRHDIYSQILSGLSNSSDSSFRWWVIDSLEGEGKSVIPYLKAILEDTTVPELAYSGALTVIGRIGPSASDAVRDLVKIAADSSRNLDIRSEALDALGKIGENAKEAQAYLFKVLGQRGSGYLRSDVVLCLVKIGCRRPEVINELVGLFIEDECNDQMFSEALEDIGANVVPIMDSLLRALPKNSPEVQCVIDILSIIGPPSKDALRRLEKILQDTTFDSDIRVAAAWAIGMIGAKDAVPELTELVTDSTCNMRIRESAVRALGYIGPDSREAVTVLTQIVKDFNNLLPSKRRQLTRFFRYRVSLPYEAITALGKIGKDAKSAIPILSECLSLSKDRYLYLTVANSLMQIARQFDDSKDIPVLKQVVGSLSRAYSSLPSRSRSSIRKDNDELLKQVKQAIRLLELEEQLNVFASIYHNKKIVGAAIFYALIFAGCGIMLWLCPLWLLRINDALTFERGHEVSVLRGILTLPLRYALVVGFFHYHSRVLDAWVIKNLATVRNEFDKKDIVKSRQIYVQTPILLDDKALPFLSVEDLRTKFENKRVFLIIIGEGGVGKTTIACQIARWAMSKDRMDRLCSEHLMIPVIIEEDLKLLVAKNKSPFLEAVRGQIRIITGSVKPVPENFLIRLLEQKRILVIVDSYSELDPSARELIDPRQPDFPVNSLIITSRLRESWGDISRTTIMPQRIKGEKLRTFLDAYLMQRNKDDLFNDKQYFDACSKLSQLVGERDVTFLLLKLFAEQMISNREGFYHEDLPKNIPDLMLQYLNLINRASGETKVEDRTVQRVAKIVAWNCLEDAFQSRSAKYDKVVGSLSEIKNCDSILSYLENQLQIIHISGVERDQVKFDLDPLAEYLAGLYVIEHYQDRKDLWHKFFNKADKISDAPGSIRGFLTAISDCCLSRSSTINIPDFVIKDLQRRTILNTIYVNDSSTLE